MPRTQKTNDTALSSSDYSIGWSHIQQWFQSQNWRTFDFQEQAWRSYIRGENGLIHSATGTGKTYAAWLGPITQWLNNNQAATIKTPVPLQVLWITPLRALAADTAESLLKPITALELPWSVQIRTGDTSSRLRNQQKKLWPSTLITTPESLSLMLSHADCQERFAELQAVIVDEWHELLGTKRGVQLELALARIRRWQPQLRTWGLSATLGNVPVAARVLVGPNAPKPTLIRGEVAKEILIDSIRPTAVERFPWAGHLGLQLLPQVIETIEEGQTSLVFTNTRAQSEIWYQAILSAKPEWAGLMALHHGSLDRQVRDWVENGLRAGSLRCVVCTSSLDLGVDFSPVDRVLQIGSPKGVARLLQRAGRSGHRPGVPSRVTCVPTNALELLETSAARKAAEAGKIEGRVPLKKPLDVLSQHVVTIAAGGGFQPAELYEEVRQTTAFADLNEMEWFWVIDFVIRGGESLRAYPDYRRVQVDDFGLHILLDPTQLRRHRMNIGTIVSDGALKIRYLRGSVLGTVEESFAAKLKPGDHFVFSGKVLEFVRIHEMTVWVKKTKKIKGVVPRWNGGRMPLSSELAEAVRGQVDQARQGHFSDEEMQNIAPILELQASWSALPSPNQLLIEQLKTREGFHLFIYPFEGRFVHEGLAALLAYRLGRDKPMTFTIAINDYGFELLSDQALKPEDWNWPKLLNSDDLAEDVVQSLNVGELARRAFREIARVAGLVSQGMPGQNKSTKQIQASSNLFYDVFRTYDPQNLLLEQAKREVLERQLEVSRLKQALDRLQQSQIVLKTLRKPTPFAFPLLVDRLRQSLSTESVSDRVRRMQQDLEKSANQSDQK